MLESSVIGGSCMALFKQLNIATLQSDIKTNQSHLTSQRQGSFINKYWIIRFKS